MTINYSKVHFKVERGKAILKLIRGEFFFSCVDCRSLHAISQVKNTKFRVSKYHKFQENIKKFNGEESQRGQSSGNGFGFDWNPSFFLYISCIDDVDELTKA
jgi:hypothetical protein